SSFIKKDGSVVMTNNLNLGNRKIVGLATPTTNTDAANKKYVDDNTAAPDLSDYLEKDGTVTMTGNLNVGNNKKINLSKPTQDNDAATKNYVDKLVHHTAVQPSHYKDEFSYLMSSGAQWTDETGGGTSFSIDKIDDLPPNKGNFHDYNHKVIYIYKFLDDVFTISGICLVAIGTISGGITLNPVVLGVVNGAGIIVAGIGKKNNYKRKIEMTRIAFTTYEKVLVELRSALRGDEFNKQEFVDRMKLVDEMIIDQTPIADRFVSRYGKKFELSKQ
ncbi:unnamed protein product, partial [Porites evermanni]